MTSAQTGRPSYAVIDGQQRLRAILDFLNDRFRLVESKNPQYRGKKFSELAQRFKDQINSYDLYISELTGYSEADIRDIFVRMNKYVVKLAPQEVRHAEHEGKFARFVERIGSWDVWKTKRIFTPKQIRRMRPVEFTAELAILILEGPQDKKKAVDLYYKQFKKSFPDEKAVEKRIRGYFDWINNAIPALQNSRFRKPVDLYSLLAL